ncbi:hypothetical protein Bhyg_09950 [Pseudolycoriella hygida]|uniref:Uncharacterized protein n=1 Tax=Pseudolycoriella hygida TaxID=35572 RepID=A0A9Q0MSL9_9DIPT|nr:hypothetical protein Bhyg_09950 [Pseudolycoriella hygida]
MTYSETSAIQTTRKYFHICFGQCAMSSTMFWFVQY